jgi:hypothetical protein
MVTSRPGIARIQAQVVRIQAGMVRIPAEVVRIPAEVVCIPAEVIGIRPAQVTQHGASTASVRAVPGTWTAAPGGVAWRTADGGRAGARWVSRWGTVIRRASVGSPAA